MDEKLRGFDMKRHIENPNEEALYAEFVSLFNKRDMELIVFGEERKITDKLSEREQRIVISTVQWLASPRGELFLRKFIRNIGYCNVGEYTTQINHISSKLSRLEAKLHKIPVWVKAIFI